MNEKLEELFFYYVSIKTRFISFDTYKKWLDKTFLLSTSKEGVLLDLQLSTHSLEQTANFFQLYFNDKLKLIDYHIVLKMIIQELKKQYNEECLQDITQKLYNIWRLLPEEISYEEPFLILNYIDDPWSYGDRNAVIRNIEALFNYYS